MLALLDYSREQAELRTREFGLLCTENGYQFVTFDPRKQLWVIVETDEALRPRELPGGLSCAAHGRSRGPIVLRAPAGLQRLHAASDAVFERRSDAIRAHAAARGQRAQHHDRRAATRARSKLRPMKERAS